MELIIKAGPGSNKLLLLVIIDMLIRIRHCYHLIALTARLQSTTQ